MRYGQDRSVLGGWGPGQVEVSRERYLIETTLGNDIICERQGLGLQMVETATVVSGTSDFCIRL